MFALAKMHSRCDSPLARAPVPASSAKGTCSRCISARRKRRGATQRAPPHLADTAEAPGPPCALPSRSSSLTRRRAQRPGVSPRAPTAHAHRAPRSSAAAPQHLRSHPSPSPSRDVARHSRTLTPHHPLSPNQADDNPMGDIGKKISDFFSGLMPKEEEPPMCARWSERWTPVAAVAPGGSPPGAPLRHPCRSTSAPGGAEHGLEAPRAYTSHSAASL